MTNATGAGTAQRRRGEGGKSLKEQYSWQLWIIVAGNSLCLYSVVQANAIRLAGLRAALSDAQSLVPVGLALVVATVLNGLLSAEAKARLVFLRWRNALPGHRAFSKYALHDPRIDVASLEQLHGSALPTDPVEQNRSWYRIFKNTENDPAVRQAHRDFLLLRDYSGLSAVFIVFYGAAAFYAITSLKVALIYLLALVAQYVLVRQAAANYGMRFATTTLARWAATEKPDTLKPPVKRGRRKGADDPSRLQEKAGEVN